MAVSRVSVLLPVPLDGPFDYRIDGDPALPPGTWVEVPFGQRMMVGCVWSADDSEPIDDARLKPLARTLDAPACPPSLRALVDYVARYTLAPRGAVLKLVMSVPAALEPPTPTLGYRLAPDLPGDMRLTPARKRVLDLAAGPSLQPAGDLAARAAVGSSVVKGLIDAGALIAGAMPEPNPVRLDPERPGAALSAAQAKGAEHLIGRVRAGLHAVDLLEGVPGSGKTEVYFEAIAEALRAGRQVLVLLPEIALTAQWLTRFAERFGAPPALWHSEVAQAQRRTTWRDIARGRVQAVVGARSALFLPLPDLGLIVVDEEHDGSFKQEDGVLYHARDMAIARGRFAPCPVVLASATPAIETCLAAGRFAVDGSTRFGHVELPERHGGAAMPAVSLIDLKQDRPAPGGFLAPRLLKAMTATFERGEQSLLYLNRRGYAPLTLCRACGHRLECPNCSAWLVTHKLRQRLVCHHCGFSRPLPEHCPACGAFDLLVPSGPGVERLVEEVGRHLPDARFALMTSDEIHKPADVQQLVEAVQAGAVDLLIGTQIVAKGHHFPHLTLVGVIDADLGLAGGDLRAAERTFQLLYQVSGRAGREDLPGHVLIQTHYPEHPVMRALAAGERDAFYASEFAQRQAAGMPPCGRLAALILSGPKLDEVQRSAIDLARAAPSYRGVRVLGPAPAPLALLRGRHRQRLLVKAIAGVDLAAIIRPWVQAVKRPSSVRLQIDIDPQSFL
ncbi:MAG: primosomal protein N' [Geminicoccaceae bacterium]